MKRRLMYLHNILSKPKSELIWQVYEVQKKLYTKNDWHNLVQANRKELLILLSDDQISKMTKEKFKFVVSQAVEKQALNYLNSLASTHSKPKSLVKQRLVMENYFKDSRFSKSEIELLFF